jgi:3-oxoacyl-[acyl-carrier protein] reductase
VRSSLLAAVKGDDMNLSNAKALVTGGSSGIGLATARLLKERGASVVICGRDRRKLDEAAAKLGVSAVPADVSNEADVVRLVRAAVETMGGLDVLVNNAGSGTFGPLMELSLEQMQSVFATNVYGAMMVAREAARVFVRQQRGNIINVASTAALRGFAGGTAYCASKFALHGMTECWRAELRKSNIRVMQINPSEVQTEFFSSAGRERPLSDRKLRAEDIGRAICSMLEMEDRGFVTEMSVWATNPD